MSLKAIDQSTSAVVDTVGDPPLVAEAAAGTSFANNDADEDSSIYDVIIQSKMGRLNRDLDVITDWTTFQAPTLYGVDDGGE